MAGWGAIRNNTTLALRKHSERMALLQEQASSGMRIIRASNGPSDAFRILNLRSEIRSYETYHENLKMVDFNMTQISEVLQSITTSLSRVKELTAQASSGTYNMENRKLAGLEIDAILETSVSMVNAKSMGRRLFGGGSLDAAPYSMQRDTDGQITSVSYEGARVELKAAISPGISYPATVVGDDIFRSTEAGRAKFLARNTGSALGSGTSSARGDIWLSVIHDQTVVLPDSHPGTLGIAMGNGSDQDDTIVGDHTLNITTNGGHNFVSLDGGDVIRFDATDTNLRVANEHGDVAYVDMSGWTGTVPASVTLRSSAEASIDGGQTTTPIDPANNNQSVTDSNGRVFYADFTHTVRTGADPIRMEGSYDLFGTLIELRDVLCNVGDLSHQEQSDVLGDAMESLEDLMSGLTQHLTSVGARVQALTTLEASLETLKFNSETEADKIQNADIVEVATELANTQTFYEMILASSSKLLSLSLLDYL
jgi:flagellar hook-associated protein 3 FlgL